jgi:hypothetical protein
MPSRVGDQDGNACTEVETEAALTRQRERLAGQELLDVVERGRQYEAAGRLDGTKRSLHEAAVLARVRRDDARLEVDAGVEAKRHGARRIAAEALRCERPVVATFDLERRLGVGALAARLQILRAELVDLGG